MVTDREINSFEERHPEAYAAFALAMKEYSSYVCEEATGGEEAAAATAAVRRKPKVSLAHSSLGFPLIPECHATQEDEDGAEYQKRVLRSFLTEHYSETVSFIQLNYTTDLLHTKDWPLASLGLMFHGQIWVHQPTLSSTRNTSLQMPRF